MFDLNYFNIYKLFGDLVDISKFKPGKSTPGRAGSM
jgi:hypothetical protein